MDKALDKSFTMNRPFRYILLFITRSFLISILFFVIIITMFLMYYLFDMFIHSGSSNTPPLYSTYMIVSPSMVPTINVNDAIVVKRIDHDNYKVGDIITFSSIDDNYKGLMITHRIVDKQSFTEKESIYTTKGDGNNQIDSSKVTTKSIYGRVLFKIPKIGYLISFFSNSIGIIIITITLLIGFFTYHFFQKKQL